MTTMTPTLLIGLTGFAFVSSITPGPNNIMLMSSGATYGLRRTLPHLAGVCVGFSVMVLLVGWGLAGLFAVVPWLQKIIRVVGAVYLVYLAYKIGTARDIAQGDATTQPIAFMPAVAFQWVNPKAWTMAIGAITAYAPAADLFANVSIVALVFALVNLPCIAIWTVFGVGLRTVLKRPGALRAFNIVMAVLLIGSVVPMLGAMI